MLVTLDDYHSVVKSTLILVVLLCGSRVIKMGVVVDKFIPSSIHE